MFPGVTSKHWNHPQWNHPNWNSPHLQFMLYLRFYFDWNITGPTQSLFFNDNAISCTHNETTQIETSQNNSRIALWMTVRLAGSYDVQSNRISNRSPWTITNCQFGEFWLFWLGGFIVGGSNVLRLPFPGSRYSLPKVNVRRMIQSWSNQVRGQIQFMSWGKAIKLHCSKFDCIAYAVLAELYKRKASTISDSEWRSNRL